MSHGLPPRPDRPPWYGVLHVPGRPPSIDCHPSLSIVEDASVLEWCLKRFRTATASGRPVILLGRDDQTWNFMAAHTDAELVRIPFVPLVQVLGEFAAQHLGSDIAICDSGSVFAPLGFVDSVVKHHRAADADYTSVIGFPENVGVDVYRADFLEGMSQLPLTVLTDGPRDVVRALMAASRVSCDQALPGVRAHIFDARQHYSFQAGELPDRVTFAGSRDLRTSLAVIRKLERDGDDSGDELLPLRLWKEASNTASLQCSRLSSALDDTSPKAKVLFVSNASAFSGAEKCLADLVAHIDQSRYQPHALVARRGFLTECLVKAGAVVWCPDDEFRTTSYANFAFIGSILDNTTVRLMRDSPPASG